MTLPKSVFVVIRGYRDYAGEWITTPITAFITKENAEDHAKMAAGVFKHSSRWGSKKWYKFKSPYDPGASDVLRRNRSVATYSVQEIPLVLHTDDFLERTPETTIS